MLDGAKSVSNGEGAANRHEAVHPEGQEAINSNETKEYMLYCTD